MELFGRRSEREAIENALGRAIAGRRTVVLVRGDPGAGKSALLGEVRSMADDAGALVLWSAVTETESALGWGGLATLLLGVDRELRSRSHPVRAGALESVLGADTAGIEPFTVASALAELLGELTADAPLVMIIDDLHWLDVASAAALSFALRLVPDQRILLVAAARPVPLPIDLPRVVGDDLTVVEPSALSLAGVRTLLADRFDLQLGRIDLVRVHEITQGNPLHVIETGRLLQSGTPIAEAIRLNSLREFIDADLGRIDPSTLTALGAAALMPQPSVGLLHQLLDPAEVDAALAVGTAHDVLRVNDDTIVFRHPLIAAGLAERLGSTARQRLHERCSELAVSPELRAFHVSEAAEGIDPVAAELLDEGAAAAAERGLPAQAFAHARRALELTDPDDPAHRRRTIALADLACGLGEAQLAVDLMQPLQAEVDDAEASGRPLPADAAEVLFSAAIAAARLHGTPAALPNLQRLARMHQPGSPELARVTGVLVTVTLYVDAGEAIEVAERARVAAEAVGDEHLAAVARSSRLVALTVCSMPIEDDRPDPASIPSMSILDDLLSVAVWTDDHDYADALSTEARGRLDHEPLHEHNVLMQTSDLRARQGRLGEAADLAERAWILADALEQDRTRSSDVCVLALLRGDVDTARRHAAICATAADADSMHLLTAHANYAVGLFEASDGDLRGAADRLRRAVAALDQVGVVDLGALPVRTELIEVLAALGATEEADALAERMTQLADLSGRVRPAAEAAFARATAAAAAGRLDAAAADAAVASRTYADLGVPVMHARSLLLAGTVARRRRQRTEARQLLERALALLESCGAYGLVPRVRSELDRLGARGGPDELTATEARIAELVATGRTNDEVAAELFVSRRTVESNLTRVYRKLGVRSRSELTARLRSR